MAYFAIAFIAPNYRDYKDQWLKAYEPGTTTPKAMALDSAAAVTVAKLQLNADGFLKSAGDALVIPYIEGAYDLWLFPTSAEADANDTSSAVRVADDINSTNLSLINDLSQAYDFDTRQDLENSAIVFPLSKKLITKGFNSIGDGGGANYIQEASAGTNIASPSNAGGHAEWQPTNGIINGLQLGLSGVDGVDDSATFVSIVNFAAGQAVFLPSNRTYSLETINTANNQTPTFTAALSVYSDDRETCIIKGSDTTPQVLRLAFDSSHLTFRNVTFDTWENCAYTPATGLTVVNSIGDISIHNCRFTRISRNALLIAHNGPIKSVSITGSVFEDFLGDGIVTGIQIGSEGFGSQQDQESFIVTGNVFRNIVSTADDVDVHGVFLWGESMIITGNVFEDIHNANFSFGSEGIYTKAKFANISYNVLKNAGYNESAINLKGTARGTGTANEGHSNIISYNIITWDSDNIYDKRGIYVRTDDLLVKGNIIDGADYGIWSGTEQLSNLDVVIKDNILRNLRSFDGISIRNFGESVYIQDNILESITYSGASTVKLITVENETAIKYAEITGNTIVVDDRCTATGEIRCINSGPTTTFEQLTIADNKIHFTNLTATPKAIKLTGIANFGRVDILNNLTTELGNTGILDYDNWLSLTSLPAKFNFVNNGAGLEGSNIANEKKKYTKVFTYDHSVDDFGTVFLGELPTGAIVTNAILSCKETFTIASGVTTVSVGITTDDNTGVLPATDINNAAFPTVGEIAQGTPNNVFSNYTNVATDVRTVRLVIAGQALTAGNMEITLEYIIA